MSPGTPGTSIRSRCDVSRSSSARTNAPSSAAAQRVGPPHHAGAGRGHPGGEHPSALCGRAAAPEVPRTQHDSLRCDATQGRRDGLVPARFHHDRLCTTRSGACFRTGPGKRDPHGPATAEYRGQERVSELAVITGTTHGIGRVTSHELARAGKTVIMLCRDVTAASTVRDEIMRHSPRARIEVVRCDLASLASVREAAAAVRRDYPPLGLLVNNAGMVSTRPSHLGRRLRAHVRDQPPGSIPAHRIAVGSPG